MARISLKGMQFYAHHGCFEQERTIGTHFVVDLWYDMDTSRAEVSDDINDAVSYLDVYQLVKAEMAIPSRLLEHVAHRIGDALMTKYRVIERVGVTVNKMAPPLGGQLEAASVSIEMGR